MAIIRDLNNSETIVSYIGTVAFFCAISCTIIMLRFRGFRASLNFSGKGSGFDHYNDTSPGVSLNGAYRCNKDELIDNFTYSEPPKRITPSMVVLPQSQSRPTIQPSKSTNDLVRPQNVQANVTNSSSDIPQTSNNNIKLTKSQIKEQQKLEKQRLAEQKKRDKLAAKERQKMEKLRKEREKQEQKARASQDRSKVIKRTAPQPRQAPVPPNPPVPPIPPVAPNPPVSSQANPQRQAPYPTNTLESSISRSSGPPPYTALSEVTSNERDDKGNIILSKPVNDSGSWDMISQHRQQLNRPTVGKSMPKQTQLDLHYNVGMSKSQDNSDA